MSGYRFLTTGLLDAPVERVWDTLHDARRWRSRWRDVRRTKVLAEDLCRSTWRSFSPSELTFEFAIGRRERWVMRNGVAGLARELGRTLVAAS